MQGRLTSAKSITQPRTMASSMRYQWHFIGIVLLVLIALAASRPLKQQRTASATDDVAAPQQRLRRRVGNLNITSTPEQYIRDLYDEYVSESGKPRQGVNKPTDVWCFPDKGEYMSILAIITLGHANTCSYRLLVMQFCQIRHILYHSSRYCQGRLQNEATSELQVCYIHTVCLPVELHSR